jgi:hypothetical protein
MKKTTAYLVILLVVWSFFSISCKKEANCNQPIPAPTPCVSDTFPCEILPTRSFPGWYETYDSILYGIPVFLPNSNDEFYVIKWNTLIPLNVYDLVKYNMVTKRETLILHDIPTEEPYAVFEDWIVYNNFRDHKLYKVSSKGGSPILITRNNDWNNFPIFLNDKRSILVQDAATNTKTYFVDLDGNIGDTIRRDIKYMACSKNNDFIGYGILNSKRTLINYSLSSGQATLIYNTNSSIDEIFSVSWNPNGQSFFYTSFLQGLCTFNVQTKERMILRSYCSSNSYSHISTSMDGTRLICALGITKPLFSNFVLNRGFISIMNIDGSCEKRVL